MPFGSASTAATNASRNADHHAASSRWSKPRATTSIANPATLPMKCDASTSGSGTCSSSRSVAAPDSGVTPETSSHAPAMNVSVASKQR